jgi:mono/diheme cytochrome c family protein
MKPWKIVGLTILVIALAAALGIVFFLQRGFRATTEPSHFEAAIARALRNVSIPHSERDAKNSMPSTPEVLNQGRDLFLSRCATCHGVDGSGKTDVGAGLYPRVPDLRSEKTQGLSDGQIHYIIENGVQLTGMPAWGNRHSATSNDSWKLTLFIRSLSPLTMPEHYEQVAQTSSATYVGSQACEKCHADIYARWKKTPMANVVRDPKAHPESIVADLAHNNIAKIDVNQVAFVYGSIWKQRYFTKVGEDLPSSCPT